MKKRLFMALSIIFVLFVFVACGSNETSNDDEYASENVSSDDEYTSDVDTEYLDDESDEDMSANEKSIYYCDSEDCNKEGTYEYETSYGVTEHYCYDHYKYIIDTFGKMEEDVGKSEYSKHTCEECSREGTYSIIGLSGLTEYYCTEHYYQMKEILDKLYGKAN